MKAVFAKRNFLLLRDDGSLHYPYAKFLTEQFSNQNTRDLVAQSLRILYRFCTANRIELAVRALDGRCLTYNEAKKLSELCWRPLGEVEEMGDKKVVSITSAKTGKAPKDLDGAVQPNTARKRLDHISSYLDFYREVFLDPNIRSHILREQLKDDYDKVGYQLRGIIKGTKHSDHLSSQSLPSDKYLAIVEAVFVRPDELFMTGAGEPSRTLLRDRAMTLLACEGLRPGTIGNIRLVDFRPNTCQLVIKDNRSKRTERITSSSLVLKMGDSTQVNNRSETMISLWPFTVHAIQEYINAERHGVLAKRMTNHSNGFLFLSDDGEPIKHRSSVTTLFNRLGKRLAAIGLLDVGNDPFFKVQKQYDFYAYVLRHSAASFFLAEKCNQIAEEYGTTLPRQYKDVPDHVKDLMKLRFGWTEHSNMPNLYAARALSEAANVILMEFNQRLLDAVQARKRERVLASGL